jgi:hypothetical protein
MTQKQRLSQRWDEFRPTKTVMAWACVASVALTMVVGFAWGGWVTGGTAQEQAAKAAEAARAQLAAAVCVDGFVDAADAGIQLAALKGLGSSSYQQRKFIEDGGWATIAGSDTPVRGAADLCAQRLIDLELPPAATAATEASEPIAQ